MNVRSSSASRRRGPIDKPMTDRFAKNLRQARAQSGLSQLQLGEAAGISASEVYRLETGSREPRLGTLLRLGRATGVGGAALLEGLDGLEDPGVMRRG